MNSLLKNDRAYLLRYNEIALKGDNRSWFEERLAISARKLIQRALGRERADLCEIEVLRQHGRVFIRSHVPPLPSAPPPEEVNAAIERALGRLFGATSFSTVRIVPTDRDAIIQASLEELQAYIRDCGMPKTFRVATKRSDKVFPERSVDLDRVFGSALGTAYPQLAVDLENPEFTLGVEIRKSETFLWTRKFPMPGGLPVGSNGRTLALISGGLDSPVAAIQILKRGSPVSFLHFHGTPYVGDEALTKVEDLVRLVNHFQPDPHPLHVVPFGKLQEKIALVTQPKLRTVLYRRMMMRIACAAAPRMRVQALVTGESLGQVASQTLENLAAIDSVATLPVLRPLITYDKDQIVSEAKRWGTYQTSIRPAADCCTLFADRHPSTRTAAEAVAKQEAKLDISGLVQEGLDNIQMRWVRDTGL